MTIITVFHDTDTFIFYFLSPDLKTGSFFPTSVCRLNNLLKFVYIYTQQ